MLFEVVKIHGAGTIEVFPEWQWNDRSGCLVGIKKLLIAEPGTHVSKIICENLEKLLMNEIIDLQFPQYINPARLLCEVYYAGVDIKDFVD
jgi:hypothetical protein